MPLSRVRQLAQQGRKLGSSLLAAITFYTAIPLPRNWVLEFCRIARWAPLVGLLIGAILGLLDIALQQLSVPILTRSTLVVGSWIALTGGLHLDGVMDTADGLAVGDRQRRLEVMSDSATGAFGAMAAIAVLLLKTAALTDIETHRVLVLMVSAGWGRWGQVVAIAFYPYLKPTGKGAFHKQTIRLPSDLLWGFVVLVGVCGLPLLELGGLWWPSLVMLGGGCAIALLTGAWLYHQLDGHTGDTYGAVVEWTEALLLCLLSSVFSL